MCFHITRTCFIEASEAYVHNVHVRGTCIVAQVHTVNYVLLSVNLYSSLFIGKDLQSLNTSK